MTANTPQSRKAKGRGFQQILTADIRKALNIPDPDAVSTAMGQTGCDIKLSTLAREKFPFGIEAKCQESLNIWKAWEQAESNAKAEGLTPVLAFKRNRTDPLVCLTWKDFLKLAGGEIE